MLGTGCRSQHRWDLREQFLLITKGLPKRIKQILKIATLLIHLRGLRSSVGLEVVLFLCLNYYPKQYENGQYHLKTNVY